MTHRLTSKNICICTRQRVHVLIAKSLGYANRDSHSHCYVQSRSTRPMLPTASLLLSAYKIQRIRIFIWNAPFSLMRTFCYFCTRKTVPLWTFGHGVYERLALARSNTIFCMYLYEKKKSKFTLSPLSAIHEPAIITPTIDVDADDAHILYAPSVENNANERRGLANFKWDIITHSPCPRAAKIYGQIFQFMSWLIVVYVALWLSDRLIEWLDPQQTLFIDSTFGSLLDSTIRFLQFHTHIIAAINIGK